VVLGFKHGNFTNLPKASFYSDYLIKQDPGLPFHFLVLNLFKSWSNLGFDQDSNEHKNLEKKIEKMKNQIT
jgi:hypothetical protein